ncbi:hypothetical protein [Domibacillus tundrae]|uniref:hypothetical protein n=1 Tax=Domibacillus tundrae TaxID=1587527 RepID=UPI000617DD64|nr:hypothetical protein [Domibacillus tundrae]
MPYTKKLWEDRIVDAGGAVVQAGTPVSAGNMNRIEQGVADAHAALEGANRQAQTIGQSVTVLNAAMNAPVNVEVEGRTLTSLGNSVLDNTKNYVLTAKRTKIKVGAGTPVYQGVAKFTGESGQPQITRIANFEDKVSGSTLENPHVSKRKSGTASTSLLPPNGFDMELSSDSGVVGYVRNQALDGSNTVVSYTNSGGIAQQLFSFDLIAEIERHIGTIPRSDVAGKVQWIKDNLSRITANFHGTGSSVGGNKVSFAYWRPTKTNYGTVNNHTSASVAKLAITYAVAGDFAEIDANAFVHLLAYAEPSDGVTPSSVSTDYIDLEIELKAGADFREPSIPLYEVDAADYAKILVDWNEDEVRRRYPAAKGTQHINGLAIIAEGENLLPPFSEWADITGGTGQISESYKVRIPSSDAVNRYYQFYVPIIESQAYVLSGVKDTIGSSIYFYFTDKNKNRIGGSLNTSGVAPTGTKYAEVIVNNGKTDVVFSNVMFSLGLVAKPFVPRNPSMLLAPTKLGAIGTVKDLLFKQDGIWKRRKAVEKDVVLDSSLNWIFTATTSTTGFKSVDTSTGVFLNSVDYQGFFTKYDGSILNKPTNYATYIEKADSGRVVLGRVYITVSNANSGWSDNYTPTANETKAFFNGWKKTAYAAVNPATPPNLAASGTAGTLPAGTYYVKYTWVTASGETMVSPETSITTTAGQQIDITLPAFPPGVTSANIYIAQTGNATKQGNTTTGTFAQSTALVIGSSIPAANTAVDQWKSVVDGTTNPTTNTIAFVSANLAPNYTPYKLSYVLATPVVETVNVEGDIVANGPTQIEVTAGAIVREKVTPVYNAPSKVYEVNRDSPTFAAGKAKNKVRTILGLYENSVPITSVAPVLPIGILDTGNGVRMSIPESSFNPAAEYTVTYLAYDRQLLTVNPLAVNTSFAQNVRSAVEDLNAKTSDNATMVSIHATLLYDVLKRLKAGGL